MTESGFLLCYRPDTTKNEVSFLREVSFWIPAFAGMTPILFALDSRFRGDDTAISPDLSQSGLPLHLPVKRQSKSFNYICKSFYRGLTCNVFLIRISENQRHQCYPCSIERRWHGWHRFTRIFCRTDIPVCQFNDTCHSQKDNNSEHHFNPGSPDCLIIQLIVTYIK